MVAVWSERDLVDERRVTAELLQSFPGLQPVDSYTQDREDVDSKIPAQDKRPQIRDVRPEATLPDGLIEGGAEELAAVLTEAETRDSFAVAALEPPQALPTLDLPHLRRHMQFVQEAGINQRCSARPLYLDLSILGPGGQHLRVPAEAHTQHGIVHHHEVILSLVLQILQTEHVYLRLKSLP